MLLGLGANDFSCAQNSQNPVILPASSVTIDRDTIARHLLSDSTDPFNRSKLTMDMLTIDHALVVSLTLTRRTYVYLLVATSLPVY
eukprot:COSAG05_NODE_4413_length_1526_cov_1.395936_3_plen_86_part_00